MKSYLKGNPELKLVLNDDLVIGNKGGYGSGVILDDCNFHQCVNTRDFESMKTLTIIPPDGEFIAMNYRITSDFVSPFRIFTYIEESDYKLELKIKIRVCNGQKVTHVEKIQELIFNLRENSQCLVKKRLFF